MKYLIDTNKVIDFLCSDKRALVLFDKRLAEGIAISVITVAEMFHGAYKSEHPKRNTERFQRFFTQTKVPLLNVDKGVAEVYSKVPGKLEREGKRGPVSDLLIAATCLKHNLILVTDNIKDFKRIESLKILQ